MYAAEVTGYTACEAYEVTQRRYFKWTLGLPKGTRSAILNTEAGIRSVRSHLLTRALKFESRLPQRRSDTLKAAHRAMLTGNGYAWKSARERSWNALGWSTGEAERRLVDPQFWHVMRQRQKDQEDQCRMASVRKCGWYIPPKAERPLFLTANFQDYKIVSRFRCGAESRMADSWRGTVACRICGYKEETWKHLVDCVKDKGRRSARELYGEEGRGLEWMKEVLRERERTLLGNRIFVPKGE